MSSFECHRLHHRDTTGTRAVRHSLQTAIGKIVEAVIVRLIGAVLLEANDEWQLQHRYMQIEGMVELVTPQLEELTATLSTPHAA